MSDLISTSNKNYRLQIGLTQEEIVKLDYLKEYFQECTPGLPDTLSYETVIGATIELLHMRVKRAKMMEEIDRMIGTSVEEMEA